MIKKLFIGCVLLFSATICHAGENINLYVGQIKILKVGDINRVAVGNSKLLSTSMLSNGQLLIIAEAEGSSNVHIWFNNGTEKDYSIYINAAFSTLEKQKQEIMTLLADVDGLKVRVVGERIALSGLVDMGYEAAIETVKSAFPVIMDLTQKGSLDSDMPDNKMVIMNIKITDFNKSYLENLGINWDTTIAGPAAALAFDGATNTKFRATPLPTPTFNSVLQETNDAGNLTNNATSAFGYFGIATEITSRINFAVNSGNALILAEPRLSARSGGEATFLAGGEFPIESSTINGSNIEFKEFGVSLSIKPVVDRNNNIRGNVSTEISSIDNSVAVNGIPGLLTRKTSTDISMKSGETLVMSGLINQQTSKDNTGVKFLSEIPILGELFKSETFRNQKSELVIFVTPTVFDAKSSINKEAIEYAKEGIKGVIDAIDEDSLDIVY